jgi:hypothetical protein
MPLKAGLLVQRVCIPAAETAMDVPAAEEAT